MEQQNELAWEPLPNNIAETITCKLCNQPMQLLRLSPHVVFWVHRGEQLKKCGHIAFRTSFLGNFKALMENKKKRLTQQIDVPENRPKT